MYNTKLVLFRTKAKSWFFSVLLYKIINNSEVEEGGFIPVNWQPEILLQITLHKKWNLELR